jgi:hypothetical protein
MATAQRLLKRAVENSGVDDTTLIVLQVEESIEPET